MASVIDKGRMDSPVDASLSMRSFNITPSDTNRFGLLDGFYVGGTGDVIVVLSDGSTVALAGVSANTLVRIPCIGINATGTTATLLVGVRF